MPQGGARNDTSWRLWAFDETQGCEPVARAVVVFRPTCRNNGSARSAATYGGTVDLVVDGLVASGVLLSRGPNDLRRVVVEASTVTGVDGLTIEITPHV